MNFIKERVTSNTYIFFCIINCSLDSSYWE